MLQIKIKTIRVLSSILTIALLSFIFLPNNGLAVEYKLDTLDTVETWQVNQDINAKRSEIQELHRQIDIYQKNIYAKQKELGSLSNQVSTLNESIAKINLEIEAAGLEVETLDLKIENTELKIDAKENEIDDQKDILAEVIRSLHRQQQKSSLLEILILNDNFSDFIADLNRLEDMQDNLFEGVENLGEIKLALNNDKDSLENEKTELDTLKNILNGKKGNLDGQKISKFNLMASTEGQEAKYQELLRQAKEEQKQIDNDIVYLEKIAREKLNRQLQLDSIDSDGLMWPIPSQRITAYFHDPDYPYRYIFEHNAIDIATPQGTALRAAESGYVAKARDGGATGYSYIMLVHADGLSSVYGHVNKINVSADQFVSKGDIIGYTGGMPGTRGAGPFSTGPHLHLEVRLNGIPVNPLNYLP
ncbi:MAG: peptidoglycan DD-metalloendopeptidase family protein [Candidatus Komeilibacteria bacterium]|jgi:murein DD-endopeptidase MepM/ murein hydrolase activator NlpD|nr:peptidoglycan DD-metalloendopeptidase family protein [Candidatus Komeilibacteria bacterium]MBT4447653.1 peptidoglycan DD-metalloendopeptidase family protein [Candidatus Komeilibacteria bacterium]